MDSTIGTPAWLQERITGYYRETTEGSYLKWAGDALALHLGLAEEGDPPVLERAELERSLLRLNAYLAEQAAIGEGTSVLDAGCGVGGSSIWLAKERGARVVGITLDPGQVELARRFARERGAATASFERMDYAATRFGSGRFEVVWNLESLCHAADPRAYLEHVRSLLREGGRFVCADFFRGTGGAEADDMCAGWVMPNLRSREELAALLGELGFTGVVSVDLTARVLPSAQVMGRIGFHELLQAELGAASGAGRRRGWEGHFRASMAAAAGLASGAITYGYVGAVR